MEAGPYGPERAQRAVVATTDPEKLLERKTWYLITNLLHPSRSERSGEGDPAAAELAEVVRLYGLRMWVEQSYKQVKHALGGSAYQVSSDLAMRRHWQLVCCAFSLCWWAYGRLPASLEEPAETENPTIPSESTGREKKEAPGILAEGVEGGERVAGAVDNARAILESIYRSAPAQRVESAA